MFTHPEYDGHEAAPCARRGDGPEGHRGAAQHQARPGLWWLPDVPLPIRPRR